MDSRNQAGDGKAKSMSAYKICARCGKRLTKQEVIDINNFGGPLYCNDCQIDWEKIRKE